jgi:hypothetical protein
MHHLNSGCHISTYTPICSGELASTVWTTELRPRQQDSFLDTPTLSVQLLQFQNPLVSGTGTTLHDVPLTQR